MLRAGFTQGFGYRARLVAYVLTVSLVPLLVFGLFTARQVGAAVEKQVEGTLLAEAEGFQQAASRGFHEREAGVRAWAEDSIVRGALFFDSYEKCDAVLDMLQRRHSMFRGLVLFKPDGRVVSANNPDLKSAFTGKEADVARAPWFRAGLTGKLQTQTVLDADNFFGRRILHFAVPVVSTADGTTAGILLAAYDWEAQMSEMVQPALLRAQERDVKTLDLLIADESGRVVFDSQHALTQIEGLSLLLTADWARKVGELENRIAAFSVNNTKVADVGDGWIFLATLEKSDARSSSAQAIRWTVVLIIVFGLLGTGGSIVISRPLVRPLARLNMAVDRIVREGDLTQEIESSPGDEIGQLVNSLLKKLKEIPLRLHESAELLNRSMGDLSESIAEQRTTIARQASALRQTQATAEQIRQMSSDASQKAESVLAMAGRAEDAGRQGEVAIEHTMSALNEIREHVAEIAQRIGVLNISAQEVGHITGTVKELADQSNMLSLNAAIEAVRSGEHGKGFAVVAREMRNLSEESAKATTQVRNILGGIGAAISDAVKLTDEGVRQMDVGATQVKSSGDSLRELSGIVKDSSGAARQIAAAVNQQNAGIAQIFAALTDLSAMMEATVKRVESTEAAVLAQRDAAEKISRVIAGFRI